MLNMNFVIKLFGIDLSIYNNILNRIFRPYIAKKIISLIIE